MTEKLDNQTAFDKACAHLRGMKHRSMMPARHGTLCAYLTPDGDRCVVGGLIDDRDILAKIADKDCAVSGLVQLVPEVGDYFSGVDVDLLVDLQEAHDAGANWGDTGFVGWRNMRRIAADFDLDPAAARRHLTSHRRRGRRRRAAT